jgi:hypothetical protein
MGICRSRVLRIWLSVEPRLRLRWRLGRLLIAWEALRARNGLLLRSSYGRGFLHFENECFVKTAVWMKFTKMSKRKRETVLCEENLDKCMRLSLTRAECRRHPRCSRSYISTRLSALLVIVQNSTQLSLGMYLTRRFATTCSRSRSRKFPASMSPSRTCVSKTQSLFANKDTLLIKANGLGQGND